MKLEHGSRLMEIVAELDDIADKLKASSESCHCEQIAGLVVASASTSLARQVTPFIYAHANPDDVAALTALANQLIAAAESKDAST